MADFIGGIPVPSPPASGLVFPLVSDFGYAYSRDFPTIDHEFGELAGLATQTFAIGAGPRRFHFQRAVLSQSDRSLLQSFFIARKGSWETFIYNVPNPDRETTTAYEVIFEVAPLTVRELVNYCQVGLTFVESDTTPAGVEYTVDSTVRRFPTDALSTALLQQVQEFVPLVRISVRNPSIPDMYFSDRRCTVAGQLYLPKLLEVGEPGSNVLMTQDISGAADNVQFNFGNADRIFGKLARYMRFADVDFLLYHVNTRTLIEQWKGIIISHQLDGSANFRVQCSDGLYPITQAYPPATLGRQCRKLFDAEIYPGFKPCPYHEVTAGLIGDPSSCDYFFNTPNGCLSHGMSPYFGGQPAFPQSVIIKDNGTGGLFKIGRSTVTSSSVVADNIWGDPLPEIWCNDDGDPRKAFWANAIIAAVRDEGDFFSVLGILGAGPLGAYEGMSVQTNADGFTFVVSPLADGFPPHGFQVDSQLHITSYHPELGLRQVLGADPATPATDAFAIGQGTPQRWDLPDPVFSNILTGEPNRILPLAAGVALTEVRYAKKADKGGLAPTPTTSHAMTVPIARGMEGVAFDQLDNRTLVPGMVNPFWVAVTSYLRALSIQGASPAVQLSSFVRSRVFRGDGTGCAEIADLIAPPIIGTTYEQQFRFQGAVGMDQLRPFRDTLTQILECAGGFFSFDFGQLSLGIRSNASVTSTFTAGNMLFQSLALTPAEEGFEYLRIDFANRDLSYQQDYSEYEDKDHAQYFGRAGRPLRSQIHSLGCSTLNQAARRAIVRTREEIGGVLRPDLADPYVEFDNNNAAVWKSTILALEVGVGDVVSITHPDLETYPGPVGGSPSPLNTWKFRVERWTLHKDYSVTMQGRSVTDSMYDPEVGPKPADHPPTPLPPLFFPIPFNPVWAPYQIQAAADDPLFANEWTFGVDVNYRAKKDGGSTPNIDVTGKLPVTAYAPGVGSPKFDQIAQFNAGGMIHGGAAIRVSIVAYDASGLPSSPSDIAIVQILAGTNTNRIVMSDITWPSIEGLTKYGIFASDKDGLICWQAEGDLTAGSDPTLYTPSTVTLAGPLARSTYALPSVNTSRVRVQVKNGKHFGIMGISVGSVATDTLVLPSFVDTVSVTPFDPTGRKIIVVGRKVGSTPYASFTIVSADLETGVTAVSPDPDGTVMAGDAIIVTFQGYDNSSNPYLFTDSGMKNQTNQPTQYSGFVPSGLIGFFARVIVGKGRGLPPRKIVANTDVQLTFELPLEMDATSILIIEEAGYRYNVDSIETSNTNPTAATTLSIPGDNYENQPILIVGFTVDRDGVLSPEDDAPVRLDWVFGDVGQAGSGPAGPNVYQAYGVQGLGIV